MYAREWERGNYTVAPKSQRRTGTFRDEQGDVVLIEAESRMDALKKAQERYGRSDLVVSRQWPAGEEPAYLNNGYFGS